MATIPLGGAAQSAPAAVAAPVGPAGIIIHLSPSVLRSEFAHDGYGEFNSPPNPPCWIPVGRQAHDAYAAIVQRMFPSGSGGAVLEIALVSSDVDFDADGWHASVGHTVVLRTPEGEELGRWRVMGRESIPPIGERAMALAFAEAAASAAARLEFEVGRSADAVRWFRDRGLAVQPADTAPPELDASPPPVLRTPDGPPRGRTVAYLDVLGDAVPFKVADTEPPVKGMAGAVALRVGLSNSWGFLQVAAARWRSTDEGGGFSATSLGLDAGALVRVRPLELAAGAGAHRVEAKWTADWAFIHERSSTSPLLASVFGAVRYTTSAIGLVRIRIGLELRRYIGGSLRFDSEPVQGVHVRQEFLLGNAFSFFVGMEGPVAPGPDRG